MSSPLKRNGNTTHDSTSSEKSSKPPTSGSVCKSTAASADDDKTKASEVAYRPRPITPHRGKHGELPLEHYGALGDGRSVALVGVDGSIDWWATPSLDSLPLFDRLLDGEKGGRFLITPLGKYTVERRYKPDSNVLEHTFTTPDGGKARITDSLNSGISGRLPWSELGRRIEGLSGSVTLDVSMNPGLRGDRARPWQEKTLHGNVMHMDGLILAIRVEECVVIVKDDDEGFHGRVVTTSGFRTTVAILASHNEPLMMPSLKTIDARIDRSEAAWREWAHNLEFEGEYAPVVRRSALALKLLLYSPSGAIAAAATTSLPESLSKSGHKKIWDYRFAWLRDACYTINSFLRVGAIEESKAAFSWLVCTINKHGGAESMKIMYTLDSEMVEDQTDVTEVPGYADVGPVRRGNRARNQLQLSVFGDLFETAGLFVDAGHVLDITTRRLLDDLADRVCDLWMQRDGGIWELLDRQHYTMSKIGCYSALDRAYELHKKGQSESSATHASRWRREKKRIAAWIHRECWSEKQQAYTMYPGTDKLDAALLLATRFTFAKKKAHRASLAKTRDAIRRSLSSGPFVYRYTGMASEEGTFLACAFWMVEAYAILGEREEGKKWMDELLQATQGDLGLLTEMVEAAPPHHALGNMPQALSHLALVHAAESLQMEQEETIDDCEDDSEDEQETPKEEETSKEHDAGSKKNT